MSEKKSFNPKIFEEKQEDSLIRDSLIIENNEYTLTKNNISYIIKVCKTRNKIVLIYGNYEISLNLAELIKINILFNVCRTIDDVYKLIITLFNKKKVKVKEIIENKILSLTLTLKSYIDDEEINFDLILLYKNQNKDFIINDIYNKYNILQEDLNKIKNDYNRMNNKLNKTIYEINKLKEEMSSLKKGKMTISRSNKNIRPKNISNINPMNLNKVYNLVNDSYNIDYLDNTFTLYNSKNNCLYLVYSTENKSIKFYSFGGQKVIQEIKNAHDDYITNFRHCFCKNEDKDIIMSISGWINNLKLWDGDNYQCILNLTNIYSNGYLFSACFLVIKNSNKKIINEMNNNRAFINSIEEEYYMLTGNRNHLGSAEGIKIYDLKGKIVNQIPDSNDNTCFIDTYLERGKDFDNYYILTGNGGYAKSYNFHNNKLHMKYYEKDNKGDHFCVVGKRIEDILKLVESCGDGFIRIWNFHSGVLLTKIDCKNGLLGICIWSQEYLFTGCKDNSIKLIDIKKEKIIKSFTGHNNYVCTIRKIVHPKYGGCIISQSWHNDEIKIWMNNPE